MSKENKALWICKMGNCARVGQSPNLNVIFDNIRANKQQRAEESEESESSNVSKRYRKNDSLSLNVLVNDMRETKKDINEIKEKLTELTNIPLAIANLSSMIENLNATIAELREDNKAKDKKIERLEEKVNEIEQVLLEKNIEITNANEENDPMELVLLLASKINANITKANIVDVYRKKRSKKIIVKFDTTNAKKEFSQKVKSQKIKASELKNQNQTYAGITGARNDFIFVNDELTSLNKRLLWMAKNQAREKNWRFVWTKNGKIMAKKSESDRVLYILAEKDICLIN